MWTCRGVQQDKGKVQNEFASWKERVRRKGKGTDAGPVRREGPVPKENWELGRKEAEEMVFLR